MTVQGAYVRYHQLLVKTLQSVLSPTIIIPKSQDFTYKLTAAVTHLGDVFSEHFITYRRRSLTKPEVKHSSRWLCTADHVVKEVSFKEVLSTEADMLFYERV